MAGTAQYRQMPPDRDASGASDKGEGVAGNHGFPRFYK